MIKKLVITRSVLLNLGDFQNSKAEVQVEHHLDAGETLESAHADLLTRVNGLLLQQISPALDQMPQFRRNNWFALLGGAPTPEAAGPDEPDDDDDDEDFDDGDDEDDEDYDVDDHSDPDDSYEDAEIDLDAIDADTDEDDEPELKLGRSVLVGQV